MNREEKKPRSMADIARSVSELEDAPTKEEILEAADQAREETVEENISEEKEPEEADAVPSDEPSEEEKTEEEEAPFDPESVPGVRFLIEPKKASTFRFLVRHSMTRVSGWVVLAIGILMIVLPFLPGAANMQKQRVLYVVLGIAMIVLPYVMMYRTAIRQERRLAGKPVQYILNDVELTSVSGDQHGSLKWNQVYRLIETKDSFILYMDKTHAVVWPVEQMGPEAIKELRRIAPQAMEPGRARLMEQK